jgi:exo-1,4-beta-D-glucosaminidase
MRAAPHHSISQWILIKFNESGNWPDARDAADNRPLPFRGAKMNYPSARLCCRLLSLALAGAAIVVPAARAVPPADSANRVALHSGWTLQSSCSLNGATGDKISALGFDTTGWHKTDVPSTVVAALVADKTYPDPDFGNNLRNIPGTEYPIGKNFSGIAMPKDSPFRCSWWYRTEFELPKHFEGKHVWLHFGGINNHANIWLNGHQVVGEKDVAGAYRTYEFDVTPEIAKSGKNVVAVEAIAQTEKDLGINWVDWNPAPPDKDMGLWRGVYLEASGPVAIRYPLVTTHFPDPASLDRADLTVEAQLHNASDKTVTGELEGGIGEIHFSQKVTLEAGQVQTVKFTPDKFAQLQFKNPKLWWPWQMGEPTMHELKMTFKFGSGISDEQSTDFGIREITSVLDEQKYRVFSINGKRILIRGGGWSPDMLLRESTERLETDFRYVLDMGLNTIRLEGKLESDAFYDMADRNGVLVMAGWCCCDKWERWKTWQPGDLEVAKASLKSQILRMRAHPSMLMWLNGSDGPPPADVETAYIQVLKDVDWPNPYLSSASQEPTKVTGDSGVKMTGPYDYVPPDYWLTDTGKEGGAYGFNTETGPGPAVPPLSCLRKMLPADHVTPGDPVWNYHAGSEGFKDLSHFEGAMDAIYGKPANLDDYEKKAQAMAYDGERAMFEAYSRNKYTSTGVIQWMLNNAWPSLIWHLYDYYLQPAGGYFGAKKACEPLHVQFSYDDHSVVVVNSRYEKADDLTVSAKLYDSNFLEKFTREAKTGVDADGVARAFVIPEDAFSGDSPVYFVSLSLENKAMKTVSRNFYWLSAKKSVYNWGKTTYRFTPVTSYEDLTALQSLPAAEPLHITATVEKGQEGRVVRVYLHNPSKNLAFQVHLGIRHKNEDMETLPVLWSDNYIELLPGEERTLLARFPNADAVSADSELTVTGWNLQPATIAVGEAKAAATKAGGGN